MKHLRVRSLKIADMEKLIHLLCRTGVLDQEGARKRARLIEWVAFHNPFAENEEPTYFIAEDEGRIVGFHGRMPMHFVINGKTEKGYYVHDLFVDPEYRKRGLGLSITMSLAKAIEEETDSFFCLFGMTPLNQQMQKRRKYHEMSTDAYTKVMNPRRRLTRILGENNPLLNITCAVASRVRSSYDQLFLKLNSYGLTLRQIERFDNRFDEFNNRILDRIGISSLKDSRLLNWKFVDRPFSNDTAFAAERNGRIVGYIVLTLLPGRKISTGRILDIMADPEDSRVISFLCGAAIDYFRRQDVDTIGCVVTDKRFARVFKRFLFSSKKRDVKALFLGNLERCVNRTKLMDIENWHLTRGESDGYMLEKLP